MNAVTNGMQDITKAQKLSQPGTRGFVMIKASNSS